MISQDIICEHPVPKKKRGKEIKNALMDNRTNHKDDQNGRLVDPPRAESLGSNCKHAYIYTCKENSFKKNGKKIVAVVELDIRRPNLLFSSMGTTIRIASNPKTLIKDKKIKTVKIDREKKKKIL